MALKLLLVPGEQSLWHRGDVLESGLFQLCSLILCVAQLAFIFSFQKLLLDL